jgi:hypothetical protein
MVFADLASQCDHLSAPEVTANKSFKTDDVYAAAEFRRSSTSCTLRTTFGPSSRTLRRAIVRGLTEVRSEVRVGRPTVREGVGQDAEVSLPTQKYLCASAVNFPAAALSLVNGQCALVNKAGVTS